MWTLFLHLLSAGVGGVAVGVLANRKPDLFAKVVKVANAVDDKANVAVAAVAAKVANPSPPSAAPPASG